MIQEHPSLTFTDSTPGDLEIPSEPHFILANHINSYRGAASFVTLAATIQKPAQIVCYSTYNGMLFLSSTIHNILHGEIQIDIRLSKTEKEHLMIQEIQMAFDRGYNVVMLIDAHRPRACMRTLNRVVLARFPTYRKQLVQLCEPVGVSEFRYRRFPATYDLDVIHQQRREILGLGRT